MSFFEQPILRYNAIASEVEGEPIFELVADYVYTWEKGGRQWRLIVPAGYLTDKASVPQIAWSLGFRPDGAHEGAAILHDFLYEFRGEPPAGSYQVFIGGEWWNVPNVWTRPDMDRLFGRMMREAGVSPWRRKLMYAAVRLFGWHSYYFGKR